MKHKPVSDHLLTTSHHVTPLPISLHPGKVLDGSRAAQPPEAVRLATVVHVASVTNAYELE